MRELGMGVLSLSLSLVLRQILRWRLVLSRDWSGVLSRVLRREGLMLRWV